ENVFEVTSYKNKEAVISAYSITKFVDYKDTFGGIMKYAADKYIEDYKPNEGRLVEVRGKMKEAENLAMTAKQKAWYKAAYDVMDRIFETDIELSPDCKEVGLWNFFCGYNVRSKNGEVVLSASYDSGVDSFEAKEMSFTDPEVFRLLYNFLYEIIQDNTGFIWNDKWKPGYKGKISAESCGDPINTDISVAENERVITPAGTFDDCRHVILDVSGYQGGLGYFGGYMECWYAEGVGLVKYKRPVNDTVENVWELTEYKGKGDGFFPINDGLVRRYEPKDIGEGCRGFVEYTYVTDESGTTIFRNACGVQSREEYEKAKKQS
ncbi:MAG: hypothetical protein J5950_07955, partial [Clostridia bacterium]|nr:hypothetical protein [Clostridia bacterium]